MTVCYRPEYIYWDNLGVQGETDIVADWIWQFGTDRQKDAIVEGIEELIPTVLRSWLGIAAGRSEGPLWLSAAVNM